MVSPFRVIFPAPPPTPPHPGRVTVKRSEPTDLPVGRIKNLRNSALKIRENLREINHYFNEKLNSISAPKPTSERIEYPPPISFILFFIFTNPFPGNSSLSGSNPFPSSLIEIENRPSKIDNLISTLVAPECFTTL